MLLDSCTEGPSQSNKARRTKSPADWEKEVKLSFIHRGQDCLCRKKSQFSPPPTHTQKTLLE